MLRFMTINSPGSIYHLMDPRKQLERLWQFLFIQCTLFLRFHQRNSSYFSVIKNLVSTPSLFCFMDGHHISRSFSHFSALALMYWNLTVFSPNVHPSLTTILHIFWHAFLHANLLAFPDSHFVQNFHIFITYTDTQKYFQSNVCAYAHRQICLNTVFCLQKLDSHNFVREVCLVLSLIC